MPAYRQPFPGAPPAPLVDVRFRWNGQDRTVTGIIDTGADGTHIPDAIAHALNLRPMSDIRVTGVEGRVELRPVYVADVEFEGFNFPACEIVGSRLSMALIGRDLLNELIARFDGPALDFGLTRSP